MSFWPAFGAQLAVNFALWQGGKQRAPLREPTPVSLGEYRQPGGRRARTTSSRPAPVSTTASYDPQSKYKATLQRLLRDDTVKQAKATKA